ncbi:MAG TPA: UDP-glucuronic acid decarboxylase family protein [Myxococcaceae bacterium]|nr:UDP-glucuronic acid decarboxylase family protein [Myxococcaceae bacterium]
MKGKRVAVLGGAGFIGSHLCERLLSDGAAHVVVVDNLLTGREANLEGLRGRPGFTFQKQDIVDGLDVEGPLDFVFNLASPASPIDYLKIPIETMRVGSIGTENALKLAEKKGAVFLQASTSEVYGDPLVHPQTEDYCGNVDPVGPRAVYDEAKRYGEAIISAYRRSRGVNTRIARIFNTYGPRMRLDDGRVVPAFVGQALRNEDFTLFGDGSQTRAFCYVRDLVDGLVRLSLSDVTDPVNLGNPREMTIREFAEAVRTAAGGGGKVVYKPLPQGDPKQRRPDITRARERLGWEPKVSLEEGLVETIAYFRRVATGPSAP